MVNIVRSNWTTAEILNSREHRGRPARVTAGSWVDDLSVLKKAIIICDMCRHKWNPGKHGYRHRALWPGQNWVQSKCDGCKQFKRADLYLHEESTY